MGKKTIAILIPVFNGLEYTKICLKSLFAQIFNPTFHEFEFKIVVIDDGSTDGTASWINENYPTVHLVFGNGNLWWSGGINKGALYAFEVLKAEFLLWWNNDILPDDDYFKELVRLLGSQSSKTIIGSKIYILNSDIIWGMGGKFDSFTGLRYMHGEQQYDSKLYKKPLYVDWFPGMGTIIHKTVFDKIGFLDEKNFPQYHGDSDFTFRAKKSGFKLIAFPDLVIYNDNTNTGLKHNNRFIDLFNSLTNIKSNYNFKKDIVFYKKHSKSIKSYIPLFNKYFRYIAGFYKWKVLNTLGIKKRK